MNNEEIRHLIDSRERTRYGIYCDVSTAIDIVSTEDLFRYYMDVIANGHDSRIRDYLETEIINAEIVKGE